MEKGGGKKKSVDTKGKSRGSKDHQMVPKDLFVKKGERKEVETVDQSLKKKMKLTSSF